MDAQASLHEALALRDGKISALGSTAEIRRLAGPDDARRRARRPHGHPGAHRLASARRARCAVVQHRGQLDRRAVAARSNSADPRGRREPAARQLAHRRRRLERAAVRRAAPADAGRARSRRARQPRLCAARLRLGRHDGRRSGEARNPRRRRSACGRHARARRRAAHGRGQRRAGRDHCAVRSAAEADVRGASAGHARIFPRAQSARAHGRRRSRRQQSLSARLSGAVRRLASRRAHGARGLQLERPNGGRGARRAHEPHGAAADGLRR